MTKNKRLNLCFLLSLSIFSFFILPLCAQTIAEKKESLRSTNADSEPFEQQLLQINDLLAQKREQLNLCYAEGKALYENKSILASYQPLVERIRHLKGEIREVEQMWRHEMGQHAELYALWHQPSATLLELIMDYGSHEAVYLVPQEIATMAVTLSSHLPIPREAWSECLHLILAQNGIGVRELNPYVRELFFLTRDVSRLHAITSEAKDLELMAPEERILFVLQAGEENPHTLHHLLMKFSNPQTTTLEVIQGDIFIVAPVSAIAEILKLHAFMKGSNRSQAYELLSLNKINAREIATILEITFPPCGEANGGLSDLRVMTFDAMPYQIFLLAPRPIMDRALKLITDIEGKVEDASEKVLFWYNAKHAQAESLAKILSQVYQALLQNSSSMTEESIAQLRSEAATPPPVPSRANIPPLAVNPQPIKMLSGAHHNAESNNSTGPFIVDPTSGSIIMVVEQAALPKIRELLKKIDVPKKMVQIEVLLFEKKLSHQNRSGLNLLRLGDMATNQDKAAARFDTSLGGIVEFFFSQAKGSILPAFDLVYKFLLTQEDIQINASPSVMTVNQTPATIAIVEEISVNTGSDGHKDRPHVLYTRAQYGITIQITPTINWDDQEGNESFVTLDTDITFDTTKKGSDDRPEVTRRHIKNHVRVADGETVILGGLRRKSSSDSCESIPFLGEIPGLGKLFSSTDMNNSSTEMFVFITPKIVADPLDGDKIRREQLARRAGDVPEFLQEMAEAKAKEKRRLFEGGLEMLLGRRG